MNGEYPYYNEPSHVRGTTSTGLRSTQTAIDESRLIVEASNKISLLEPRKHPLVTLLTNVGRVWDGKAWQGSSMMKAATGSPKFIEFEDVYGAKYAKVSGTYAASGAVTITVSGAGTESAYSFTVGDQIKNFRTGEVMLVATIASATTITVATTGRAFGSGLAAAGADGDTLFIIGNVNEEGAGSRNINTTKIGNQENYTQIFKTTIGVTRTEDMSNLYGGSDMTFQRAKKGTEHMLDIERAFWFGQKKLSTGTNGHPVRATGGIQEFIEQGGSYVQNQAGVLTEADFNAFLKEGFTYGDSQKYLFAGSTVVNAISGFAAGKLDTKTGDSTYGVSISDYMTPFGTIKIVHNPLFVADAAGMAFLLDMSSFKYRYLNGSDTKLMTNIQANDEDRVVDQYLSECGLERKLAAQNALLKGVTD